MDFIGSGNNKAPAQAFNVKQPGNAIDNDFDLSESEAEDNKAIKSSPAVARNEPMFKREQSVFEEKKSESDESDLSPRFEVAENQPNNSIPSE
jgi:hypothetical protein